MTIRLTSRPTRVSYSSQTARGQYRQSLFALGGRARESDLYYFRRRTNDSGSGFEYQGDGVGRHDISSMFVDEVAFRKTT